MKTFIVLVLPVFLAAFTQNSLAVDNFDNSQLLASQCYQCHGPNGRSKGEIDSLAGRTATDIYGDLLDMKNKQDVDIMHLQAKIYTDEELRKIANYLSTLTY